MLPEQVHVIYSQERLASYGIKTGTLARKLEARNLKRGSGEIDVGGKTVFLHPSGEFKSEGEIRDVIVGTTAQGAPLYLRHVTDVARGMRIRPAT